MLKIKDDVDLKKLEEFGFDEEDGIYVWNNVFNNYMIMVHKDGKTITTILDTDADDVLYELIKADLVEKVSDTNEI